MYVRQTSTSAETAGLRHNKSNQNTVKPILTNSIAQHRTQSAECDKRRDSAAEHGRGSFVIAERRRRRRHPEQNAARYLVR